MKVVYSHDHLGHSPSYEFRRGKKVRAFERPSRVKAILSEFRKQKYGELIVPDTDDIPILEIHDEEYVVFLKEVYQRGLKEGVQNELTPYCWPNSVADSVPPKALFGQIGFFAGDGGTPIVKGTWAAAYSAAACAATAARQITRHGERFVFALTRPPGHHASRNKYSGYCYLNNAAIACTQLRKDGFNRVALLDLDYHHGNGSQSIFESRSDVFYISLHADPDYEYPFFSGRKHEVGIGEGEGYTKNFPLRPGTGWTEYEITLIEALSAIPEYNADVLVVSLGLDTSEDDALGTFKLSPEAYNELGGLLANLKLPTVFVLEGGYDYKKIGGYVYRLLSAFEKIASNKGGG